MERKEIVSFNAVRGIAALTVCVSHLRSFLMVKFPFVVDPTHADSAFYFLTGLGHQAVVVFFVMSGWLVGSSVWSQQLSGRFSWVQYAITRLTRLLIVLIPALVMTCFVDALGTWLSGGYGYDRSQSVLLSDGPGPDKPISDSLRTAVGNLFFLQTIRVPVYGTNAPLWSLANEFRYYVMFPLFAFAWFHRRSRRSIGFIGAGVGVLVAMPFVISSAFAIWLTGWAGSMAAPRPRTAQVLRLVCSVLVVGCLVAGRTRFAGVGDFALGIAVAGLLIGLNAFPDQGTRFQGAARIFSYLAQISFTLYLFHFPLLAFFFFALHIPQQQPSPLVYVEFVALLAVVLVVATCFWYLFERNTDLVRRFVSRARRAPVPPTPGARATG
jgi:peptidoglycan/LPS O-acetylase OafA/YrhL